MRMTEREDRKAVVGISVASTLRVVFYSVFCRGNTRQAFQRIQKSSR